jgi:hypothetical protein
VAKLWRESTAATRKTGLFEFFTSTRDAQSGQFINSTADEGETQQNKHESSRDRWNGPI